MLNIEALSTKELIERLQLSHGLSFRDNLNPAIRLDFVEMMIPDKSDSSKKNIEGYRGGL